MLRLQAAVNTKIDPNWLMAGYPYLRAVLVEAVEAMEHHGWKWWSRQEKDLSQIRLELIDIWHFVLSDMLIKHKGNAEAAADHIIREWSLKDAQFPDSMTLIEQLEAMAGLAAARRFSFPLFRATTSDLGLPLPELFKSYVGKNVLNHFRQDNGYKQGTYIKVWAGREDNEWLTEILGTASAEPEKLAESIYESLRRQYTAVAAKT